MKSYYRTEGRHEKIICEIPKGHYQVIFSRTSNFTRFINFIHVSIPHLIFSLIILILLVTTILLGLKNIEYQNRLFTHEQFKTELIWQDIINAEPPLHIVLADQFTFQQFYDGEKYEIVRNWNVNSLDDLELFMKAYPDRRLEPRKNIGLFDRNSIWGLPSIMSILSNNQHAFSFLASSQMTAKHIQESNIIYMGSYVELGLLSPYLNQLGVQYQFKRDENTRQCVRYFDKHEGIEKNLHFKWREDQIHNDITVFAHLPTQDNKTVTIFASLHGIGNKAVSEHLTCAENLKQLAGQLQSDPDELPQYFYLIFETSGYHRIGFDVKLKYFENVSEDFKLL